MKKVLHVQGDFLLHRGFFQWLEEIRFVEGETEMKAREFCVSRVIQYAYSLQRVRLKLKSEEQKKKCQENKCGKNGWIKD